MSLHVCGVVCSFARAGARQIGTLLNELKRSKGKYGVTSMCIGSGMGAAAVFEREN
jgi:acetyl-CoA acetyltransferase